MANPRGQELDRACLRSRPLEIAAGSHPEHNHFHLWLLPCWLVDFHDSRGFDYRGLLLAFREFLRTFAVDVHAGELFAISVIHGDLPVVMFAPAIMLHATCF